MRRALSAVACTGLVAWLESGPLAYAEGHGAAPAHGAAEAAEAPSRTDVLELGGFRVRGSRRTDQEVTDVRFTVTLVLSSSATPADFHRLEHWRQRLRDQVIIAVRGADPRDFVDPELRRLQRLILFRVKRLPTGVGVIGVYLADFTLEEGETLADQMVLPVTPSAPAPKPAEGGH